MFFLSNIFLLFFSHQTATVLCSCYPYFPLFLTSLNSSYKWPSGSNSDPYFPIFLTSLNSSYKWPSGSNSEAFYNCCYICNILDMLAIQFLFFQDHHNCSLTTTTNIYICIYICIYYFFGMAETNINQSSNVGNDSAFNVFYSWQHCKVHMDAWKGPPHFFPPVVTAQAVQLVCAVGIYV